MKAQLTPQNLADLTAHTLQYYHANVDSFWEATKDHDVKQNYRSLLGAMPQKKGLRILDLGCGPGRDLLYFKSLGHVPTGLDGCAEFCAKARNYSGCEVLHQNFLELSLPEASFDGIFANASLFHVPHQEIQRVLTELKAALVPKGILFSSNPRGAGEGWSGGRYGAYFEWEDYKALLSQVGFELLNHYYRPHGLPREQQPWLAVVSRKKD